MFDDRPDRIRKVYLRLVKQAEQVLLRYGTFQLVLFHADTVIHHIRVNLCLLLSYLVGTPTQKGLRPSRSGMERSTALSQIVTVVIRSRPRIPFEGGSSTVLRDNRHEQIVAVQLQTGVCVHGFQPFKFRLFYLRLIPVIRYQRTVLFGCFYIVIQRTFLYLLPIRIQPN